MASPADRYAAARHRSAHPAFQEFAGTFDFALDQFQIDACAALEEGRGVLVAAPTGAGKTVVGEFAVHLALARGQKCFYTTPIKALSNQKYRDLVTRHGAERIGLLTGDTTINGDAPIVVMTTEVLRNMLYAGSSTLHGLGYVVMDEVHYLADRFRGAVWEEVIIHLAPSVTVAALSATVSNAEEFGAWLETVRGDTAVIVEEHRPVPLWQHVLVGNRLHDLFSDEAERVVNPELMRTALREQRQRKAGGSRERSRGAGRSELTPYRFDVIERLAAASLLPAICFVFSRAACDDAVRQCLAAGLRLNTAAERQAVRNFVLEATRHIPDSDLYALDFGEWLEGLERGIASHHAGLLPTFKEIVEHLFQDGLLKVVYATETLALGINMPARSVVLEKLVKWNGEAHVELTPGEYTQLTGRAGRRGIDVEGHGIVVWHAGLDPQALGGLASTRTYPLRSSFRPSYNMAVNLMARLGRHVSREVLETSFAQFQADRSVVGMAAQLRRFEEGLDGYREAMTCHLGDFEEYAALRERLNRREKDLTRNAAAQRRDDALTSLRALRPGDVFIIPGGRRAGGAVVISNPGGPADEPRPLILTVDRQVRRVTSVEITVPVEAIGRVRIPKNFTPRVPYMKRDLANALREVVDAHGGEPVRKRRSTDEDPQIAELRQRLRQHPCHGCDEREQHARWAERYMRAKREMRDLEQRVEGRTNTIARRFDRICSVLEELGYLEGSGDATRVTAEGTLLMRLYAEADLLTARCLQSGAWVDLAPADLAAACSALVFEARVADANESPRLPRGAVRQALERMDAERDVLVETERRHRLEPTRALDAGFAWATHRWSSGASLQSVLDDQEITAGDFVRWTRQVIDLLGQITQALPIDDPLRATALQAADSLNRGVVSTVSTL